MSSPTMPNASAAAAATRATLPPPPVLTGAASAIPAGVGSVSSALVSLSALAPAGAPASLAQAANPDIKVLKDFGHTAQSSVTLPPAALRIFSRLTPATQEAVAKEVATRLATDATSAEVNDEALGAAGAYIQANPKAAQVVDAVKAVRKELIATDAAAAAAAAPAPRGFLGSCYDTLVAPVKEFFTGAVNWVRSFFESESDETPSAEATSAPTEGTSAAAAADSSEDDVALVHEAPADGAGEASEAAPASRGFLGSCYNTLVAPVGAFFTGAANWVRSLFEAAPAATPPAPTDLEQLTAFKQTLAAPGADMKALFEALPQHLKGEFVRRVGTAAQENLGAAIILANPSSPFVQGVISEMHADAVIVEGARAAAREERETAARALAADAESFASGGGVSAAAGHGVTPPASGSGGDHVSMARVEAARALAATAATPPAATAAAGTPPPAADEADKEKVA